MKLVASRFPVLVFAILLGVTLMAAGPNAPLAAGDSFNFDLGMDYGDSETSAEFTVMQTGCILVQLPWWNAAGSTKKAEELSLVLYGPDPSGYYARSDGGASGTFPLWTSYAVGPSEIGSRNKWKVAVFNFSRSGTAQGTVSVEYPPNQMPCEFRAAIPRDRTPGKVVLSWRYTGLSFSGNFIVERSSNGVRWSTVRDCSTGFSSRSVNYACTDTGLTSGATYYYRACTGSNTSCRRGDATTPPVPVRAP